MLEISDLWVEVAGKTVLKGVNLRIDYGEVHVLLGPNGSGKTTLINAIIGDPRFKVIRGSIRFKGIDITNMPINERVKLGIGVGFQMPPKIRGVKLGDLLREISLRFGGKSDIDELAKSLNMHEFLDREVNVGFSGGELKRCEVLQVLVQSPDLAIFDEPDSGVDVENLSLLAKAINDFCGLSDKPIMRKRSALIITHLGYILNYIKADRAHVIMDGVVACSGRPDEIIENIKNHGFEGCYRCLRERVNG
jgi:Fe-S cluster assembly ATP-binding protein